MKMSVEKDYLATHVDPDLNEWLREEAFKSRKSKSAFVAAILSDYRGRIESQRSRGVIDGGARDW